MTGTKKATVRFAASVCSNAAITDAATPLPANPATKPWQPVSDAPPRRQLKRVCRIVHLMDDAGEFVHILDMFLPDDPDEDSSGHDPEEPSLLINHRDIGHAMMRGEGGDVFLVHAGEGCGRDALRERAQRRLIACLK